ncbi:MAG: hypothetical protein ABI318_24485, partial [Chthoniobacteraceae bacterium]
VAALVRTRALLAQWDQPADSHPRLPIWRECCRTIVAKDRARVFLAAVNLSQWPPSDFSI